MTKTGLRPAFGPPSLGPRISYGGARARVPPPPLVCASGLQAQWVSATLLGDIWKDTCWKIFGKSCWRRYNRTGHRTERHLRKLVHYLYTDAWNQHFCGCCYRVQWSTGWQPLIECLTVPRWMRRQSGLSASYGGQVSVPPTDASARMVTSRQKRQQEDGHSAAGGGGGEQRWAGGLGRQRQGPVGHISGALTLSATRRNKCGACAGLLIDHGAAPPEVRLEEDWRLFYCYLWQYMFASSS